MDLMQSACLLTRRGSLLTEGAVQWRTCSRGLGEWAVPTSPGERPQETPACQHHDLALLSSRTLRKFTFLLFKSPSLWYFVLETLAKEYECILMS